jgi:hypothetical protein
LLDNTRGRHGLTKSGLIGIAGRRIRRMRSIKVTALFAVWANRARCRGQPVSIRRTAGNRRSTQFGACLGLDFAGRD